MKSMMGIILDEWIDKGLKELTHVRSGSAIPVGGKYRAIDFVLSNIVNSGISNVGVITQYRYRSLMDHIGSGKEWDLDRKRDGIFIFPPALSESDSGWYKGTADAMYKNLTFLKRSNEEFVVIVEGKGIYKMFFDEMLDFHIENGADITLAYTKNTDLLPHEVSSLNVVNVNGEERIEDFQQKPLNPISDNISMGVYILKRRLLISLIEDCAAHGEYDFVRDILIKKIHSLKIFGFRYEGYWRNINTVKAYFKCNMELLDPEIRYQLFYQKGKVYTKVKDEAPAKYNEEAQVKNSIIADGCIIEGTVENSVLFRGVTVKKGAVIKDSIVMQGAIIGEESTIQYAILDKNVILTRDKFVKGEPEWPIIISKNVVV